MPDNTLRLAYLARGQLHLLAEGAAPRVLESAYGQQVRERAARLSQRNAWKTQGTGAQFMSGGALWGQGPETDPAAVPVHVTGLAQAEPGTLLYTLSTGAVSGVFARSVEADAAEELRLYHGNDWSVQSPAAHPEAPWVACTVRGPRSQGGSHIGVMAREGGRLQEVTEGDTVDAHPSWVPGEPQTLVYESAGIGRGPGGEFVELGPTSIQRLDLRSGTLTTLAEDPAHDLCRPRVSADGALYCVRRPRRRGALLSPLRVGRLLLDTLLLPLRLLVALFQFLNFFTMRYTGKPLDTASGARQRQADVKRMMLWGNLLSAQKAAAQEPADNAPRAPAEWELLRQRPGAAPEVLARGVAVFDVGADGSVLYSDGVDLTLRSADGKERKVGKASHVEQVLLVR